MGMEAQVSPVAKAMVWTGRVLSILLGLFLIFDGVLKLIQPEFVRDTTKKIGFAEETILPLGIVLLISTLLYLYPRTAVLGAILLTGYLGGATAARVQQGDGSFMFPVSFGVLVWIGLVLRDARLRSLTPVRH